MYILIRGSVYQMRPVAQEGSASANIEITVKLDSNIDAFGDEAMFNGQSASSKCAFKSTEEGCVLCYLENDSGRSFIEQLLAEQNMDKIRFVQSIRLCQPWTIFDVKTLSQQMQRLDFSKNELVYNEADLIDNVYFVIEGEFVLSVRLEDGIFKSPKAEQSSFSPLKNQALLEQANAGPADQRFVHKLPGEAHHCSFSRQILSYGRGECFGEEIIPLQGKKLGTVVCSSERGAVYVVRVSNIESSLPS